MHDSLNFGHLAAGLRVLFADNFVQFGLSLPHNNQLDFALLSHSAISVGYIGHGRRHVFSNRSVKQREDILTNKLAANTHVIACKTQIAQCAALNNWGDTWNIIRWWAIMF